MSNSSKDIKDKTTKLLSIVYHKTNTELGELYHKLVSNIEEILTDEDDKPQFEPGDLVISPVDIIVPGTKMCTLPTGKSIYDDILIKAGEIFEFEERLIPYIHTSLFSPDVKSAVKWARLDECQKIDKILFNGVNSAVYDEARYKPEFGYGRAVDLVNQRLKELKSLQQNER